MEWMANATPQPLYYRERDPVPISLSSASQIWFRVTSEFYRIPFGVPREMV